MCGRFSLATSREKIQEQFEIEVADNLQLSFNIAPTHGAYVITNENGGQLDYYFWGLIPYWSKEGKNLGKLINARGEGIATKPSFRIPIRRRRCLVPADSFYEWRRQGQRKIPYRIRLKNDKLLAMAGIWDVWKKGDQEIRTFSIITTTPNRELSELHSRMPVIIGDRTQQQQWLTDISLDEVLDMLQPLPDDQLDIYRVSEKLNSPSNNSIDLHQSVPEPPTLFGI